MAAEDRWPRFAAAAAELGIGSMISFQLYVQQDALGALNLYGATGTRFGDEAQLIGELFASHAVLAFSGTRRNRQLSEALESRDVIGQAKGMLMPAFNLLVRASQESNIKLTDVARWMVERHEHPGQPHRPPNE